MTTKNQNKKVKIRLTTPLATATASLAPKTIIERNQAEAEILVSAGFAHIYTGDEPAIVERAVKPAQGQKAVKPAQGKKAVKSATGEQRG